MWKQIRAFLFGAPKDVHSEKTFHSISLVAMLAWVGLGADGLSSSSYGPDAAFREIMTPGRDFSSLAVFLAVGTAVKHAAGELHRAPSGRPFTVGDKGKTVAEIFA